jgi:hypothetical protein
LRAWYLIIAVFVALYCPAKPLLAGESDHLKASGYIKNFVIFRDQNDDTNVEALSRLRLRLDIKQSENASFELAYELLPRLRENGPRGDSPTLPRPGLLAYRAVDLDQTIYPSSETSGSDFALMQNLDRAFLALSTERFDITIGRQPVSFGSARVINPSDIISPFTYDTIAKEELVGSDSIRVKTPLAEMGEFDLGVVFGDDFEPDKSAAFLRLRSYFLMTDFSFMSMAFRENILLSIDLARSIRDAGVWLEASQTFAGGISDYTPEENYFRLSAGSDYSFTDKLYSYIEYHYSGAGSGNPGDYFNAVSETAFTDGAVYLLGRHYIAPGFSYEITPLFILNAQALINMEDGSILFSPGIEYSLAQDAFFQLRAFIGLGEESSDISDPESEFGLYPDVYYTALNIYF